MQADPRLGGLHLALNRSRVDGIVIKAFDWDQTACRVYAANHGAERVEKAGTVFS
jgi:tRNA (cytosine38-C5)-methyltransferase